MDARRMRRRPAASVTTSILAALAVTSCAGSPPTAEPEGDPGGAEAVASLEEVYAAVDGLEGQERTEELISLAQAEDENGPFVVYLTANAEAHEPWLESFAEKTGIEIEPYRASSSDLLQRLIQEDQAGQTQADVVHTNEPEMVILNRDHELFLPLQTPATEGLPADAVHDTWVVYSSNAFITVWNPNLVTDPPKDWNDLCTRFRGQMIFEVTDWEWFATLTEKYFKPELGMTEAETVDFFKSCVRGSAASDGHTLATNLVIAEEYAVLPDAYINRVQLNIADGAPLEWTPPIEPLVVRPAGPGIHKLTDRPATSLLYIEHMLSDELQELLLEQSFIPANPEIEGNPTADYQTVYQDTAELLPERDKWESLYEEILMEVSGDVIVED